MTTQQKWRFLVWGVVLSAVHFTAICLCWNARLLLQRPEDMIGSGNTKPYWPPYPLADSLENIAHILGYPFATLGQYWHANYQGVWRMAGNEGLLEVFATILILLNSFLWGFALALIIRFLFARRRFANEQRVP